MTDPTKACALTEEEIKTLIGDHGRNLIDYSSTGGTYAEEKLERINYLNKRLKAFSEPEEKSPLAKAIAETPDKPTEDKPATSTWGTPTNG